MEYYKIHSLWKRQGWYFEQGKKESSDYQKGRQSFIIGDYAEPEFECIKKWRVTEKIDGTNIRIELTRTAEKVKVAIRGRTDNAQIPAHLFRYLEDKFASEIGIHRFTTSFPEAGRVILFGEGYGPKIQHCGSLYASEAGFVLFDVVVGNWVLKLDDVKSVADQVQVPCVPDLGIMTTDQIVEFVKAQPKSIFSKHPQVMEGIIATPEPVMMYRKGGPIKMKLKCKEFCEKNV